MNALLMILSLAGVTAAQMLLLHWLDRPKTSGRVRIRPARSALVKHPND